MPIVKSAKIIRYVSLSIFIISLVCPCFDTEKEIATFGQGGELLIGGIMWFIAGSLGFLWLANPLLLLSWLSIGKRPDRSFISSVVAVLIALCFLFFKDIILNEGGVGTTPLIARRIGYWLWLASMIVMVFGNLYLQLSSKKES